MLSQRMAILLQKLLEVHLLNSAPQVDFGKRRILLPVSQDPRHLGMLHLGWAGAQRGGQYSAGLLNTDPSQPL